MAAEHNVNVSAEIDAPNCARGNHRLGAFSRLRSALRRRRLYFFSAFGPFSAGWARVSLSRNAREERRFFYFSVF
jgi:hypothetical protein